MPAKLISSAGIGWELLMYSTASFTSYAFVEPSVYVYAIQYQHAFPYSLEILSSCHNDGSSIGPFSGAVFSEKSSLSVEA